MAIASVGADSAGGNVATLTGLTWPAVQANDVAVMWWLGINSVTWTDPGNFTLINSTDGDTGASRMRLYYRVCTGAETGDVSLVHSAADRQCAVMAIYRGCDPVTPINLTTGWAVRDESASGTTHACPQVTTDVADCVVLTAIGERASSGTTGWTAPPGYTERADSDGLATGTGGTSCALADDGLATSRPAGTNVTPPVWTSTNGFATANILTWTVSIRPAVIGRPPQLVAATAVAVHRAASW